MATDKNEPTENLDFLSGWQMGIAIKRKSLIDAIERGDETKVRRLIQEGVPTSKINDEGETAAHLAARVNNLEILKYLLSENSDFLLNAKDKTGRNILHTSVENNSIDIVKYLIEDWKFDVLQVANLFQGNSAVHLAAIKGHTEILKYFIEKSHVNVDELNNEGEPLVFLAAKNANLPALKYLIEECYADIFITDYRNRNILFSAVMSHDIAVLKYILDERRSDLPIDWKDKEGRTVLHWSVLNNSLEISQYIIDRKRANVNEADEMGKTPLHLAAEAGHIKLVELLYHSGADPTMLDMNNKTAIQLSNNEKVVQFLTNFAKVRARRSMSKLLNPVRRFPTSMIGAVRPGNIACNFGLDFLTSRGLIDNHIPDISYVPYYGLNSLLMLANVTVSTYFKRV